MRLPRQALEPVAALFERARVVVTDPALDDSSAPWQTVALAEGVRADGGLLIVSEPEGLAGRVGRARRCLPAGAELALLRPPGARGVRGAMRRLFEAPGAGLEDACEALLRSRLAGVRARSIGRDGWLAWGRVRPPG